MYNLIYSHRRLRWACSWSDLAYLAIQNSRWQWKELSWAKLRGVRGEPAFSPTNAPSLYSSSSSSDKHSSISSVFSSQKQSNRGCLARGQLLAFTSTHKAIHVALNTYHSRPLQTSDDCPLNSVERCLSPFDFTWTDIEFTCLKILTLKLSWTATEFWQRVSISAYMFCVW